MKDSLLKEKDEIAMQIDTVVASHQELEGDISLSGKVASVMKKKRRKEETGMNAKI